MQTSTSLMKLALGVGELSSPVQAKRSFTCDKLSEYKLSELYLFTIMTSPPFLKSLRWHIKKLTLFLFDPNELQL